MYLLINNQIKVDSHRFNVGDVQVLLLFLNSRHRHNLEICLNHKFIKFPESLGYLLVRL